MQFEYGSMHKFMQQLVVLCTFGVAMDCWFEDFEAHYEQFLVAYIE